MIAPQQFTNKQLLDELARRLYQDTANQANEEIVRLEGEIQQLADKLRECEKGKSQFLSNVRNEINNPLTSILGLAAAMANISPDEKLKRMSSLIYRQACDLDFQMRNIMIAAEIELGEVRLTPTRVNIVTLIQNQVSYLKEKIERKRVPVTLYMPDALMFSTDAYAFQTICRNLLANSIEFCGDNKLVIIEVKEVEGSLELLVRDFGTGIDPIDQEKVFDRFMQRDSGLTKCHGGHGLGLSIVKELTMLLGGKITLQSSTGQGTSIRIILPEFSTETDHAGLSQFGNELLFTDEMEF